MTDRTVSPDVASELVAQVDVGARDPVALWERRLTARLNLGASKFGRSLSWERASCTV